MWLQWLYLLAVLTVIATVLLTVFYFSTKYNAENYEELLVSQGCPSAQLQELVQLNNCKIDGVITPNANSLRTVRGNELIRPDLQGNYGGFTVACLSTGNRPFTRYTIGSVVDYCNKKKHRFVLRQKEYPIPNRILNAGIKQANWEKLFWLRELLDTIDTEYLVWIDDDILVTNSGVDLESFIKRDPGKDLYISYDRWSDSFIFPNKALFNSGVMLLKNSAGSRRILDHAIATYYTHDGWGWGRFNDQTAIEYVYLTTNGEGFSVIPHGSLQALSGFIIGEHRKDDFLYHLAGLPAKRRLSISKAMVSKGAVQIAEVNA